MVIPCGLRFDPSSCETGRVSTPPPLHHGRTAGNHGLPLRMSLGTVAPLAGDHRGTQAGAFDGLTEAVSREEEDSVPFLTRGSPRQTTAPPWFITLDEL